MAIYKKRHRLQHAPQSIKNVEKRKNQDTGEISGHALRALEHLPFKRIQKSTQISQASG